MSCNCLKNTLTKSKKSFTKLCGKKNNDYGYVEGRHQIAQERTHAPVRVEGLNIRRTKIKAECLYFDSGIGHLRKFYDKEAPRMIKKNIRRALSKRKSDLARILSNKFINEDDPL